MKEKRLREGLGYFLRISGHKRISEYYLKSTGHLSEQICTST